MKTKTLKFKRRPLTDKRRIEITNWLKDQGDCKLHFVLWAETTCLDISGIYAGEPVFRPAICGWEAWKAAWAYSRSGDADV